MKIAIHKLILLMQEEIDLLQSLKTILSKQKDAIYKDHSENFTYLVKQEEDLLFRIKKIDNERVVQTEILAQKLNIKKIINLDNLAKKLSDNEARIIINLKKRYLDLLTEIRKINLENRFLIRKSVSFIEKSLAVLKEFTKNDYIYSNDGHYGNLSAVSKRLIDTNL